MNTVHSGHPQLLDVIGCVSIWQCLVRWWRCDIQREMRDCKRCQGFHSGKYLTEIPRFAMKFSLVPVRQHRGRSSRYWSFEVIVAVWHEMSITTWTRITCNERDSMLFHLILILDWHVTYSCRFIRILPTCFHCGGKCNVLATSPL